SSLGNGKLEGDLTARAGLNTAQCHGAAIIAIVGFFLKPADPRSRCLEGAGENSVSGGDRIGRATDVRRTGALPRGEEPHRVKLSGVGTGDLQSAGGTSPLDEKMILGCGGHREIP